MKAQDLVTSATPKVSKALPWILACSTILLTTLALYLRIHSPGFAFLQSLEWIGYDHFVRGAVPYARPMDPRLTGVFIDDIAIRQLNSGYLRYGEQSLKCELPWPRYVYGLILREMTAQGALSVGFDILFDQNFSPETNIVRAITGVEGTSDEFFAQIIAQGTNIVLASEGQIFPAEIFRESGASVGNIFARSDDGVLRRAKPFSFHTNRVWHTDIIHVARALELDLTRAEIRQNKVLLPPIVGNFLLEQPFHEIPILPDGRLVSDEGVPSVEKAFTNQVNRVWHMGILLGAKALELDLDRAKEVKGALVIPGKNGLVREIPLDRDGMFYIDWVGESSVLVNKDRNRLLKLLLWDAARDKLRSAGLDESKEALPTFFKGKVVVVGSIGTGNNIADHGSSPLEDKALLVTKHLCVANSVLSGRFVKVSSSGAEFALILGLGCASALLSWRLRALTASLLVFLIGLTYIAGAKFAFAQTHYYLPVLLPVFGALLMTNFVMVTYRVVFEQKEQRRLKSVFNRVVAPEVVSELLHAESLNLGGSRRRVTVFFADVRGFTEMTDALQARADEVVHQNQWSQMEIDAYYNQQARETLATVNLYLATIADTIKRHGGTLDKYIGDCVMAFWGAPIENTNHASACVRAAIEAQRSLESLNENRILENRRRAELAANLENAASFAQNLEPLPVLSCGTGINTGLVTVGLMGSDKHILNYTVFGREVNLASRLEGVSGKSRIVIGEATYQDLLIHDPELATTCRELPQERVKGFRELVRIYEVPWK